MTHSFVKNKSYYRLQNYDQYRHPTLNHSHRYYVVDPKLELIKDNSILAPTTTF